MRVRQFLEILGIAIRPASHRGAKREVPGSAVGHRGAPESVRVLRETGGAPGSAPESALPVGR